jgi:hypothetical protein
MTSQVFGVFATKSNVFTEAYTVTDIEKNIDSDCDSNNYPNKSSLVLNVVITCLEDDEQLVKRNILDFLNTHMRPTHEMFSGQDLDVLCEALLYLFVNRDGSNTRKINNWFFGKPH